MSMKFYIKIFFVLISMFFVLISCKKEKMERGETPISVLSGVPLRRDIESFLDLSAEIKPVKEVDISSDVPGKIVNIMKYEGSFVNYGDTIALVDRFVVGANYAYARARSPISGYVTTTYLPIGSSVSAGTPIANVADIRRLEVQIEVPERYVESINLGQKIFIRVPSSPDKEIEATITKRDFVVSTNTRTLMVKGSVDNRNSTLLPGMFSDVSILVNEAKNVIVVPNSSVFVGDDGKNYLYVIREDVPSVADSDIEVANGKDKEKQSPNFVQKIFSTVMGLVGMGGDKEESKMPQTSYRAYQREINVLFASDDKLALSGGLEDGEEVVMFGREFLQDGSLVNPIRNDSSILEYTTIKTNGMESNNLNTNNVSTNNVNTKNANTKNVSTNNVNTKNVSTNNVNTKNVSTNNVNTVAN